MNTNDVSITEINFEELDDATDNGSSNENQVEHLQSIMGGMVKPLMVVNFRKEKWTIEEYVRLATV